MPKAALIRSSRCVALAGLVSLCFCGVALGKDADDGEDEPAKQLRRQTSSTWNPTIQLLTVSADQSDRSVREALALKPPYTETRSLKYTSVAVNSAIVTIYPDIVGYVGGYYQWDNNWKFSGRFGVQSFGGAQLLNLTPFQPFTQPIVRLDQDRMDDNDNRLFGVTAQISWMPKPSYQLTVRTPLYALRN
jgi:hypothetical protein